MKLQLVSLSSAKTGNGERASLALSNDCKIHVPVPAPHSWCYINKYFLFNTNNIKWKCKNNLLQGLSAKLLLVLAVLSSLWGCQRLSMSNHACNSIYNQLDQTVYQRKKAKQFAAFCHHCKCNLFDFWTVGQTKQAILRCYIKLFMTFCRLNGWLIPTNIQQMDW